MISTPHPAQALLVLTGCATTKTTASDSGEAADEDHDSTPAEQTSAEDVENITITIDFVGCSKRTTKIVSHVDGTQTVTIDVTETEASDDDNSSGIFTED